ncbi:MAG: hypothetical protein M3Y04_09255 [Actinomycetota bacterium]|nr:hypothetical protein [Actinomycetota bacterium]
MLSEACRTRRRVTVAAGVAGVGAAHLIAYGLAYADPATRAHVLRDTGHGYFAVALWLAAATATLTVAAVAARGAARVTTRAGISSVVPGLGPLAGWQAGLFLAVEVSERAITGSPLGETVHGREVLIGLAVQVVVAAAIVVILGATDRFAGGIATAGSGPALTPFGPRTVLHPTTTQPLGRATRDATRSRAPPWRSDRLRSADR